MNNGNYIYQVAITGQSMVLYIIFNPHDILYYLHFIYLEMRVQINNLPNVSQL